MNLTAASLLQDIAAFQAQTIGSLFGTDKDEAKGDLFSTLLAQHTNANKAGAKLDDLPGSSASSNALATNGRNLSLFDPESAYRMMSYINNRDVLYKAQFSELNQMKAGVAQMQAAGEGLKHITTDTPDAGIKALLNNFVDRYNHWRDSFDDDIADGGLLDKMQAAEVSMYELEQSVKNRFFGARDGLNGLSDLGIQIDPATHFASLDETRLDAALSNNRQAIVNTIQDFSANFAKSAGLLNAENNFIPRQLDNLSRVIHYINDNRDSLRQEFGTGDAARPGGKVAEALSAYNRQYA